MDHVTIHIDFSIVHILIFDSYVQIVLFMSVECIYIIPGYTHISCSMAGSETTSQTLGYAIWELARNPEVQHRLRAELESFERDASYDDLHTKLPYLDAVMRETCAQSICHIKLQLILSQGYEFIL